MKELFFIIFISFAYMNFTFGQTEVVSYWANTNYLEFEGKEENYERFEEYDLKFEDDKLTIVKTPLDTVFRENISIYQEENFELIGKNENIEIKVILKESRYIINVFEKGIFRFYKKE